LPEVVLQLHEKGLFGGACIYIYIYIHTYTYIHTCAHICNQIVQLAPTSGLPEVVLQLHEKGLFGGAQLATIQVPIDEEILDDRGDPLVFQGLEPFLFEVRHVWS
jgi:hypothetical protein